MCQQNNLHTQGHERHTEPAAPLVVFNTPFFLKSVFTNFRTTHTQLSLICSPSCCSSGAATVCPSVRLPLFSHLAEVPCVFPHGFVNAALSHSPTWCTPRWSDRCCSSECGSRIPTCHTTSYVALHTAAAQEQLQRLLQLVWTSRHFTR